MTVGSEDPLKTQGHILFNRGQVEHVLTMANLKLKRSLFVCLAQISRHVFINISYKSNTFSVVKCAMG